MYNIDSQFYEFHRMLLSLHIILDTSTELTSGTKSRKSVHQNPTNQNSIGEIPVYLGCPDVDPMHSPKIGYSCCSQ